MADLGITALKAEVNENITTNGNQEITGAVLNDALIDTIDTLQKAATVHDGLFYNSQAGDVVAKTITADDFILTPGGSIKVRFENANTAASATLNVNGTGAHSIVFNGGLTTATNTWGANEIIEFTYNNYNAGTWEARVWRLEKVSVSQNNLTGHVDITIGDTTTPVASVKDLEVIPPLQSTVDNLVQYIRNIHPQNLLDGIEWLHGNYDSDGVWHSSDYYRTLVLTTRGVEDFEMNANATIVTFAGDNVGRYRTYQQSFKTMATETKIAITFPYTYLPTHFIHYGFTECPKGYEWVHSFNLVCPDDLEENFWMNIWGEKGYGETYMLTGYIPVAPGKRVLPGYVNSLYQPTYALVTYITAFNSDLEVLPSAGTASQTGDYLVPDGVYYIRVTIQKAYANKFKVNVVDADDHRYVYDTYFEKLGLPIEQELYISEYKRKYRQFSENQPLMNGLKMRHIGGLTKPYICLTSDDGDIGVATYSIPMCISKGIPMTFAIMRGSPVLQEPYLTTLKDAIDNNGFTVAQHGYFAWNNLTEDALNQFFSEEKEYWDSIGLSMKGAACPTGVPSDLSAVLAGTLFGVHRGGWQEKPDIMPAYGYYQNGERSNINALCSLGLATRYTTDIIDEAIANNYLLVVHYHEADLTDNLKTAIESWIDYALAHNVEFITLDKIESII